MFFDDGGDFLCPALTQHAECLIQLVYISFYIVKNAVRTILSFLPLFEELDGVYLLVFHIDLIEAFRVKDVIQLQQAFGLF